MSVYKDPKSPFYRYDFQINGSRFSGSTKTANKKDAQTIERKIKTDTMAELVQLRKTGDGPLLLRFAAGRYMQEVGNHHVNARTTHTDLERLLKYFGPDYRLVDIKNDDISQLVNWRRSQTVKGQTRDKNGQPVKSISHATVNRSTIFLLRALFGRAKNHWDYAFPNEPKWGLHILSEPKERIRFLDKPEAIALDEAVRTDYALWFKFARLTGLRRNETIILWKNVNVFAKQISAIGKGNRQVQTPITPDIQEILDQCKGHHDDYVFTYVCQRPSVGQKRGDRYPITSEGAKTQWRRLRARARVENFRFHDIRHDVGTKLLRETGNLKLVQRALNHSDIKTTVKYAHVLDEDVAAALFKVGNPSNSSSNSFRKVA